MTRGSRCVTQEDDNMGWAQKCNECEIFVGNWCKNRFLVKHYLVSKMQKKSAFFALPKSCTGLLRCYIFRVGKIAFFSLVHMVGNPGQPWLFTSSWSSRERSLWIAEKREHFSISQHMFGFFFLLFLEEEDVSWIFMAVSAIYRTFHSKLGCIFVSPFLFSTFHFKALTKQFLNWHRIAKISFIFTLPLPRSCLLFMSGGYKS